MAQRFVDSIDYLVSCGYWVEISRNAHYTYTVVARHTNYTISEIGKCWRRALNRVAVRAKKR